jgi:hypothetical protein
MHARGPRLELVGELASGLDDLEDAVHVRRVNAVKVDGVRVRARVQQTDAERVALGGPNHGAWRGAVVRPCREEDARCDLEVVVGRRQRVLANPPALRRERRRRVEQVVEIGRAADRGHLLAEHGGMAAVAGPVRRRLTRLGMARVVVCARRSRTVERQLAHERHGRERRGGGKQLPARDPVFSHT